MSRPWELSTRIQVEASMTHSELRNLSTTTR